MDDNPKLVVLISGKRKCGKDFICNYLQSLYSDDSCIVRISEPLKSIYAEQHGLSLQELISDGPYKEQYRKDMIDWSDQIRAEEPGYFCKAACSKSPKKSVWIVSDIRRKTDIKWFKLHYGDKVKLVRLTANDDVRRGRGWVHTPGVDDHTSECDLDDITEWDLQISNNSTNLECIDLLKQLIVPSI